MSGQNIASFLERVRGRLSAHSIAWSITPQGFDLVEVDMADGRVVKQRWVLSSFPQGPGYASLEDESTVQYVADHISTERSL